MDAIATLGVAMATGVASSAPRSTAAVSWSVGPDPGPVPPSGPLIAGREQG